jgi:predicted secreted hydrolase
MKKKLLLIVLIVVTVILITQSVEFSAPVERSPSLADRSRLSELLGSNDLEGYAKAIESRTFSFPEDHGPHADFRNEWWYVTGNLDSACGQRFGIELTFFRFALAPTASVSTSRWSSNQVVIAHFAVTDVENNEFYVAQRFSRGALGLAGAQAMPFAVWLEDWSIRASQQEGEADIENWVLSVSDESISLDLRLIAAKRPVLNGIDGLSQKSATAGNASYYYSISRLDSVGTLQIANETFEVSGLSWLDREWSSSALAADQAGWDWFALQLDDGSELMLYQLRRLDGSRDPFSAGTWISRSGDSIHLDADEFRIDTSQFWDSPTGGRYPNAWQLSVPSLDLQLDVQPVIDDQELRTTVLYWEGAVDVSGKRNGKKQGGRGYVELTGYSG